MSDLPKTLPDGSVVISPKQVRLHKQSELLAFLVGSPLLIWAGTRKRALNEAERAFLVAMGISGFFIDRHLHKQFKKAEKNRQK